MILIWFDFLIYKNKNDFYMSMLQTHVFVSFYYDNPTVYMLCCSIHHVMYYHESWHYFMTCKSCFHVLEMWPVAWYLAQTLKICSIKLKYFCFNFILSTLMIWWWNKASIFVCIFLSKELIGLMCLAIIIPNLWIILSIDLIILGKH